MIGKLIISSDKIVTVETETELIKYKFASFGARLGARLIDTLILIIPSYFIPILTGWLYISLQQSGKRQSTIGQEALGIKLLSLDGSKVSFGQATGRFILDVLSILTFLLGYIMFFFNKKNQCLHDYLSDCIVVEEIERVSKIITSE